MAQNITLMGASYSAVPAVTLPKTGGGTASFTDVSDTTATAADVASGTYFYTAAGVRTEGTASGGGGGGNTVTLLMYDNSGGGPAIYCPPSATWTGWDMDPDTYLITGTLTISENDLFVAKCPIGLSNPSSSVVTFTKMTGLGNRVSSDVYLCYTGTSSGTVTW